MQRVKEAGARAAKAEGGEGGGDKPGRGRRRGKSGGLRAARRA